MSRLPSSVVAKLYHDVFTLRVTAEGKSEAVFYSNDENRAKAKNFVESNSNAYRIDDTQLGRALDHAWKSGVYKEEILDNAAGLASYRFAAEAGKTVHVFAENASSQRIYRSIEASGLASNGSTEKIVYHLKNGDVVLTPHQLAEKDAVDSVNNFIVPRNNIETQELLMSVAEVQSSAERLRCAEAALAEVKTREIAAMEAVNVAELKAEQEKALVNEELARKQAALDSARDNQREDAIRQEKIEETTAEDKQKELDDAVAQDRQRAEAIRQEKIEATTAEDKQKELDDAVAQDRQREETIRKEKIEATAAEDKQKELDDAVAHDRQREETIRKEKIEATTAEDKQKELDDAVAQDRQRAEAIRQEKIEATTAEDKRKELDDAVAQDRQRAEAIRQEKIEATTAEDKRKELDDAVAQDRQREEATILESRKEVEELSSSAKDTAQDAIEQLEAERNQAYANVEAVTAKANEAVAVAKEVAGAATDARVRAEDAVQNSRTELIEAEFKSNALGATGWLDVGDTKDGEYDVSAPKSDPPSGKMPEAEGVSPQEATAPTEPSSADSAQDQPTIEGDMAPFEHTNPDFVLDDDQEASTREEDNDGGRASQSETNTQSQQPRSVSSESSDKQTSSAEEEARMSRFEERAYDTIEEAIEVELGTGFGQPGI